jgi:hypothetical protein
MNLGSGDEQPLRSWPPTAARRLLVRAEADAEVGLASASGQ